ncbi:MAG: T9SS type A sorting domain-containing protein [Chitinophagales bacterium]|nr:T9SS type A sorting domain-containing protein [Chitinophagales bacterium]
MKSTITLLSILSCVLWFSAYAETEPNDTKAQANKLTLNSSNSGAIGSSSDVDWWKVATTADGKLDVTLAVGNSIYCQFYLYDKDGITVLANNYTNGTLTISRDGLAPGTYYIYIFPYDNSQLPTYTISNLLTVAPLANDPEPNDTYTISNPLAPDGSVTGHCGYYYDQVRDMEDWWSVTTTGDGKLTLTLSVQNAQYFFWQLYDHNGATLISQQYTNGTLAFSVDGLAAGTYYVKVFGYSTDGFTSYSLTSAFTPAPVANDAEPNDSKSQAKNIPLNSSKTGHVGYYYDGARDMVDWYKFTTNADGLVKLTMNSYNNQYIFWQLFDKDGVTSIYNQYTNGLLSYSADGLAAGTYYVKVYAYNSDGFIPYSLSDSLFSAPVANDIEPNNGKSTATVFALGSSVTGHIGYYYDNERDSIDWYKLTTSEDGQIGLTITSYNAQYLFVQLYDNDGTTLLQSSYTNGSITVNTDGLAAGVYYAKIFAYYVYGFVPYTLSNTFTGYTNIDDGRVNEIPKNAATLNANEPTPGHVGFRANGGTIDYVDWWKINYTGKSDMTVTLNWEPQICCGQTYVYLVIYADTSQAPIFQQFSNSGSLNANLTNLDKQYYYVKVYMYYNYQWMAYNLTPTFTQKEKAKITLQSSVVGTDCASSSLTYKCTKSEKPYTVQLFRFGKKYGDAINVKNSTPFTINSLPPGSYYAIVYGDGATGQGKGTSETTTLVPVPTNLSTSNIKSAKATLNWDTLVCVDYDSIYYRVVGSGTWNKIKTGTNNSAYNLTGLTASTMYEWKVAHVVDTLNEKATSAYSGIATFTTAALKEGEALLNETGTLSLYPNPAANITTLQFENKESGEALIKVVDGLGRIVLSEQLQVNSGLSSYEMDLSGLSQGLYLLTLRIKESEESIKLIKQ